MNQTLHLDLAFRGSRDYLQGADIYGAMIEKGGGLLPEGGAAIQFHTLLRKQPDLICSTEPLTHLRQQAEYRGEGVFASGEAKMNVVLLESERPVDERVPCNEKEVVATASVDVEKREAVLPFPNTGNFMEMTVFLNKQLHFKVLPDVMEKWLFVKLELTNSRVTKGQGEMKLVMKQVLGRRFTRTEIFVDGKSAGHITFSTAK